MKTTYLWVGGAAAVVLVGWTLLPRQTRTQAPQPPVVNTPAPEQPALPAPLHIPSSSPWPLNQDVKVPASQLSADAIADFQSRFPRYQTVISNFCRAFEGHLRFSADEVTPDKLAARVGPDYSREFVFLVNGVTFSVVDSANDGVEVFYLNAGADTARMCSIPAEPPTPILKPPVEKAEVIRMLKAHSGTQFKASEVRMIPTGISGALNGGVNVIVGGDINNFFTWKHYIVFDPDAKMIFYIKGR